MPLCTSNQTEVKWSFVGFSDYVILFFLGCRFSPSFLSFPLTQQARIAHAVFSASHLVFLEPGQFASVEDLLFS